MLYQIAENIDMKLNFMVGKINHVSLNFILPIFNTSIKTLNAYTLMSKHVFRIARLQYYVPIHIQVFKMNNSTKETASLPTNFSLLSAIG